MAGAPLAGTSPLLGTQRCGCAGIPARQPAAGGVRCQRARRSMADRQVCSTPVVYDWLSSTSVQAWKWRAFAASAQSLDVLIKDLEQKGAERAPMRCYKREEIEEEIEAIVEGGKETGKDVVARQFLPGQYEEAIATEFYATTMDGKSTLGKMSFNNWKPSDLVTTIDSSVNKRGEVGGSQEYRTEVDFTFTENGMKGRSALVGSYRLDEEDPAKIIVQFAQVRLGPGSSDPADVKAWKEFLGPHNPTMDDDGSVVTSFEKGPQSWLKFIYMDKDVQCFESQRGTFHMVKRRR